MFTPRVSFLHRSRAGERAQLLHAVRGADDAVVDGDEAQGVRRRRRSGVSDASEPSVAAADGASDRRRRPTGRCDARRVSSVCRVLGVFFRFHLRGPEMRQKRALSFCLI